MKHSWKYEIVAVEAAFWMGLTIILGLMAISAGTLD